jgi:hypothetical protein
MLMKVKELVGSQESIQGNPAPSFLLMRAERYSGCMIKPLKRKASIVIRTGDFTDFLVASSLSVQ